MKATNIRNNRNPGFTLVEIMIVVAIIGLLAAIAIPNFVRARTSSQTNACINNLRQIDGACQQWALENKKVTTDAAPSPTQVKDYLKNFVVCPSAGGVTANDANMAASYAIGKVGIAPTCLIVAATHVMP